MSETQQQRFADLLTRSDELNARLVRRTEPALKKIDRLVGAAESAKTASRKVQWLRRGADVLGDAVRDICACGPGCAHCCTIPVMVLASEARVIAKEIGRPFVDVPRDRRNMDPPPWRGPGHECTFLVGGLCSIHDVRPLPCRLLFNLDKDNFLCRHDVDEGSALVPYVNTQLLELSAVAVLSGRDEYTAELRDFFPAIPDLP
ncbi:YkgJ family cysteine cluster protein [Paracidovorax wautersii]|uniref:YkgJ family cysteine cluster protein n=1 Tax=Paracidovorax wautersii TaxID=1177982 RepID=UPI001113C0F5|nr:YkgJ family cysteine cluster protein [Paracidovorax wautersii]